MKVAEREGTMWLEEKSETMKLLPDNVTVLYFARDRVEPYVEVGLHVIL